MMGHRGRLINGDEWDALSPWKRFLHWRPGERKRIKRGYNRRQRQAWRLSLRESQKGAEWGKIS